jgi:predicted molibdopterin-dependent oxidoreductase YjgC
MIEIRIDGEVVRVSAGISVAAALLNNSRYAFRTSVSGESRAPLCGMGICFECRVSIDGSEHVRACLVTVRQGMDIRCA